MSKLTLGDPVVRRPLSKVRRALLLTGTLALVILIYAVGIFGRTLYTNLFEPDPNAVTLKYSTEDGKVGGEANTGVVNSPLRIDVRIPWSDGSVDNIISGIKLNLLDASGNPALFGNNAVPTLEMRPTSDVRVWEYVGSVPSIPGVYHAEVQVQRLYSKSGPERPVLQEQGLTAITEPGAPLATGYVFTRDGNLWMLATDGSRQRRLTFLTTANEIAEHPAWSPDGKSIAFTFQAKTLASELPKTSIWTIKPDGTGLQPLVKNSETESLTYPEWSVDGKYLYFTAERLQDNGVVTQQNRSIDRVEMAIGVRSQWLPAAVMPAPTGAGDEIVYLEELSEAERASATTFQRVTKAESDEGARSVLVDNTDFYSLYGPRMSPDRKWVVFSAVAELLGNKNNKDTGFDLMKWLSFEPRSASAHDVPWDLFMVPAEGGEAKRITTLNDDQMHPVWLDAQTIAFMGIKGLQTITIDSAGNPVGEPHKLMEGVIHSTVTWYEP